MIQGISLLSNKVEDPMKDSKLIYHLPRLRDPAACFGGLLYYMTSDGHIIALQVLPQANNATSAAAAATTITTNAAPTPNSTSTTSATSGAIGDRLG